MKKSLVSVLVVLCFIMGHAGCFADDIYPERINFPGLEWEMTYSEVKKLIPGFDEDYEPYMSYDIFIDAVMKGHADTDESKYNKKLTWNVSEGEPPFKIAGYNGLYYELYFVCPVGEDGYLNRNPDDALLIFGEYFPDVEDGYEAYPDLVKKLSEIYGDIDYRETFDDDDDADDEIDDDDDADDEIDDEDDDEIDEDDFDYDSHMGDIVWYGSDGTMVSLTSRMYPGTSLILSIRYCSGSAARLQDEAYAAFCREDKSNR